MRSAQWMIEVHGPELPILKKLEECGLSVRVVAKPAQLISVVVTRQ